MPPRQLTAMFVAAALDVVGALVVVAALGAAPLALALDVVTVEPVATASARPGSSVQAALQVRVKSGYHVQANPAANASLIPITLSVDPSSMLTSDPPVYPSPRRMRLPGDTDDLLVYDGTFPIVVPLKVARNASPGDKLAVRGTLRYQACDDSHCLFPASVPVLITVAVTGP